MIGIKHNNMSRPLNIYCSRIYIAFDQNEVNILYIFSVQWQTHDFNVGGSNYIVTNHGIFFIAAQPKITTLLRCDEDE